VTAMADETRIDRWMCAVRLVKTRPIETRVGAPVAVTCYIDNRPPPINREMAPGIMAVRGEGRPSKRVPRELERMRRAPHG
jgi:ribosome-associated heat shock protein Hsp15